MEYRNSEQEIEKQKNILKFIVSGVLELEYSLMLKIAVIMTVLCILITGICFLLCGEVGYTVSISDISAVDKYEINHEDWRPYEYYLIINVTAVQNYEVNEIEYHKVVDYNKTYRVTSKEYIYYPDIPEYIYEDTQSGKLRYFRFNPSVTFEFSDTPGYILIILTVACYLFALLLYIAQLIKEDITATTEGIYNYEEMINKNEGIEKIVEENMKGTYVYKDRTDDM